MESTTQADGEHHDRNHVESWLWTLPRKALLWTSVRRLAEIWSTKVRAWFCVEILFVFQAQLSDLVLVYSYRQVFAFARD